ncbi:MAG: SRPBCC family protein [Steroidobacteraceae bacterium]
MSHTIRLHRVLAAPPSRVFKAFTDADAKAKWLPPHGYVGRVHSLDLRVGGEYRMSFTSLASGSSHSFGGTYLEIVPDVLLRYTDRFDDPNLPGEIIVTVRFRAVSCGTELDIVQEGVPEAIPAEACYLGWQQSMQLLTQLVETEAP